jgi:hypothetical protein
MARQRRRQPLTYDSRKAGGMNQTNFGDIAKTFTEGQRYIREVAERTDKKIQDNVNQVMESTDYKYIGQADIDSASADVMNGIRNDLFAEKAKIGVDGYSVNDFNKVYNKAMNSAKTFGGIQEFAKTQLEAISKNDKLSDIVKDGFINHIGAAFSKDGKYRIDFRQGDIIMTSYQEDEDGNVIEVPTDMKRFFINGQDEIEKFDALGSVAEVQKIYMDRQKDYLGVDFQQIQGNPGLWAETLTTSGEGPKFKAFLDSHIENFSKSDDAIAYAYDSMGMKLGRDISQRNGKFLLSDEQRKEIGENYRTMIEGQMGIKQDGQGRYIAAPSVSGGSSKASPLQTSYSYSPSVLLADGPAKEKWSQQVMAASLVSSTLPKSERSLISSQDSGKLLETKIEASYIDDKAALALFKDVNQDMYIHPGKGKPFLADANDMKYTPVGISADLASQDIQELAINSSNNRKFENISGVMVVERDVKDEYGNVTKEHFFRLRGNVELESTETARQVAFKGGNLAKDDASISASQNRRLYTTEFSNPLNDTDTMQVIKAISKVNPSFKARYETALVVAARNGVDQYDPVSKRKIHADFLKSLVTSPVAK